MSKLLDRRTLLRGAGGAALALPALEAMLPRKAWAAKAPRRFMILWTGNGFVLDDLYLKGAANGVTEKWELTKELTALAPVRQHLTVVEGAMHHSTGDGESCAGAHPGNHQAALTGTWAGKGSGYAGQNNKCGGSGMAVGPSIDYFIGEHLKGQTKINTYTMKTVPTLDNPTITVPFVLPGAKPLIAQPNPYSVYDTFFKDFTPPAADGKPDPRALAQVEGRKRVLDLVRGEYNALRPKLGQSDRARMEQHVTLIDEIEKGLGFASTVSCKKPGAPAAGINWQSAGSDMPQTADAMFKLIAVGFACDLSRNLNIMLGSGANPTSTKYSFLGINTDHHDLSHLRGESYAGLSKIQTWHAGVVAKFIQLLQDTPDVDGTSVLDNTIVMWTSEHGRGWKHDTDAPHLLFGKGGGFLRPGRYVKYERSKGNSHNRVLLTMLEYMGVKKEFLGRPDYGTTSFPELRA